VPPRSHPDPLVDAFERLRRSDDARPLVLAPGREASRGDVARLAGLIARRLARSGVAPASIVGLTAPNGAGFLAGLLACLGSGRTVLLLDRGVPEAAARRALDHCKAAGLIQCRSAWPGSGDDVVVESIPRERAAPEVGTGVIKLTSGSAGDPRGIRAPTTSLLADDAALVSTMGIRDGDRLLSAVPFSHSYGLSSLAVPALVRGIPLVLPGAIGPFEPLSAARAAHATVFPTVPAYLAGLLRVQDPPPLPESIRLVISAGAPLHAETARTFHTRYGRRVHVFYGASECGGIAYDREGGAAEDGTVGEPVDGVTVDLEPTDAAGATRVVVRSPAVAETYLPDADARLGSGRFVSDDLAKWRDGRLALVGRLGSFISVRGQKVNPTEVERALAELADVLDAKVVGEPRGVGGDESVRAIVACRPGSLTVDTVLAWCRERLSDFKVPRSVVLVDRIPVDDRGKVDRAALDVLAEPRRTGRDGG
jgi:long-chain acyl-CoA synthetase